MDETGAAPTRRGTTIEFEYIHPLQAGKVLGLLYGILALIFVPFLIIGPMFQGGGEAAGAAGIAVFLLLLYPLMGFLCGALMAAIYNFVAGMIGGFRIDLK